jgi:hypothetical protein
MDAKSPDDAKHEAYATAQILWTMVLSGKWDVQCEGLKALAALSSSMCAENQVGLWLTAVDAMRTPDVSRDDKMHEAFGVIAGALRSVDGAPTDSTFCAARLVMNLWRGMRAINNDVGSTSFTAVMAKRASSVLVLPLLDFYSQHRAECDGGHAGGGGDGGCLCQQLLPCDQRALHRQIPQTLAESLSAANDALFPT